MNVFDFMIVDYVFCIVIVFVEVDFGVIEFFKVLLVYLFFFFGDYDYLMGFELIFVGVKFIGKEGFLIVY